MRTVQKSESEAPKTVEDAKKPVERKRARVPLNSNTLMSDVQGKEPGFHYAWINEEDVYKFEQADYAHVRHPVVVGGKRIDVSTGPTDKFIIRPVGLGQIQFLMRLPEEFHREEMALLEAKNREQIASRVRDFNSDGLTGEAKEGTQIPVHPGFRTA